MKVKNKGSIPTQREYEKEEKARLQIKEYFRAGQISSEVAVFTMRLLGYSAARAKQIVRQWADEK